MVRSRCAVVAERLTTVSRRRVSHRRVMVPMDGGCTDALVAMLMAPPAVAGESRGDVTTTASAPSSPQYPEFWISTTSVNVA